MSASTNLNYLIEMYQHYNKSNLDKAHLMCAMCNTWLSSPIFLTSDIGNICSECSQTVDVQKVRNKCLENLLKSTKFPCKNFGNKCLTLSVDIKEHEKECQTNIVCPDCKNDLTIDESILLHWNTCCKYLEIKMEQPSASLPLHINQEVFYLQLDFMGRLIFVKVSLHTIENYILLWFCEEYEFVATPVRVKFVHGNDEYISSGKTGLLTDLANNLKYAVKLTIPNLNLSKSKFSLDIYFDQFEQIEVILDLLADYECTCDCRYISFPKPCPNQSMGCMAYVNNSIRHSCPLNCPEECSECDFELRSRPHYISHLRECHTAMVINIKQPSWIDIQSRCTKILNFMNNLIEFRWYFQDSVVNWEITKHYGTCITYDIKFDNDDYSVQALSCSFENLESTLNIPVSQKDWKCSIFLNI